MKEVHMEVKEVLYHRLTIEIEDEEYKRLIGLPDSFLAEELGENYMSDGTMDHNIYFIDAEIDLV